MFEGNIAIQDCVATPDYHHDVDSRVLLKAALDRDDRATHVLLQGTVKFKKQ